MKIAIAGPDGSGKSSVCQNLAKNLDNSIVVYAGKREFLLTSTKIVFYLWKKTQPLGTPFYLLMQYLFYYPFEFIENIFKFCKKRNENSIIFDRHPIDRIMLPYELRNMLNEGRITKKRFFFEFPFRFLWSYIYFNFSPKVDKVFILIPSVDQCFVNGNGQYKTKIEARIKLNAYKKSYDCLKKKGNFEVIKIKDSMSIEDITELIQSKAQKIGK